MGSVVELKCVSTLRRVPVRPIYIQGSTKVGEYIMKPSIICPAIHLQNDVVYVNQPKNVDKGLVISGDSHRDIFKIIKSCEEYTPRYHRMVQGFLTSENNFVNRAQATDIAYKEGIITNHELLTSKKLK